MTWEEPQTRKPVTWFHSRIVFLTACIIYLISLGIGSLGIEMISFYVILGGVGLIASLRKFRIGITLVLLSGLGALGGYIGGQSYVEQVHQLKTLSFLTKDFTEKVHITGTIGSLAYTGDASATYRLYIDTIDNYSPQEIGKNIAILVEIPRNLTIEPGDVLSFSSRIQGILDFPLEGFERYVWKSGVYGKVFLPEFEVIQKQEPSILSKIQESTKHRVYQGFPKDIASIVLGMTLGNTDLLSSSTKKVFIASGISHILVVSGSNIAFVILFVLLFIQYIPLRTYGRSGVIILFVVLYGSLVGWDTPVIRAVLMGSVAYLGVQYRKNVSSISLLFLIACGIITLSPLTLLYDAGFGLSFCATLGILLFHKKIDDFFTKLGVPNSISPFFSVTLSATLGSLPITVFHFQTLSVGGILANILIAGLLGWILFMSVIYLILSLFGTSFLYFSGLLVYIPAKILLSVADFFSLGLHIDIPENLGISIALIFLGYFAVEVFLFEKRKLTGESE